MPTLLQALEAQANPEQAKIAQRFFKTGPGEYGEHDVFWGIPNPKFVKLPNSIERYRRQSLPCFCNIPCMKSG